MVFLKGDCVVAGNAASVEKSRRMTMPGESREVWPPFSLFKGLNVGLGLHALLETMPALRVSKLCICTYTVKKTRERCPHNRGRLGGIWSEVGTTAIIPILHYSTSGGLRTN